MDLKASIANQTAFVLRLAHRAAAVAIAGEDSNLAISPVSIHTILGLIAARANIPTLHQILSVLGSPKAGDLKDLSSQVVSLVLSNGATAGGHRMCFSNWVFVDASLSLKPAFKEIAVFAYKAEAKAVDFQNKADRVKAEVNSWQNIRRLVKDGFVIRKPHKIH